LVSFTSFSRAGLFFVVAVVLMASAPWVLLQPDQEVRTELDRWFLTVAGSVDAITAGVLLALARRLRRTLLVLELAGAVIVAGEIILLLQPTFAAILAIGVVPLIAYQYWRDVRMLHMPRLAGICRPDGPAFRLKTATMSSLALTTVDPVHGSLGEDEARPKLQGTGEG
jgi:hypothetical protein